MLECGMFSGRGVGSRRSCTDTYCNARYARYARQGSASVLADSPVLLALAVLEDSIGRIGDRRPSFHFPLIPIRRPYTLWDPMGIIQTLHN